MVWRYILAFALSLLVLLAFDAFYKKAFNGLNFFFDSFSFFLILLSLCSESVEVH